MQQREATYDVRSLLIDLKSCNTRSDLQSGKRIHARALESGNDSNIYVATALVKMYAKCGSMADAHRAFCCIQKPDVVSWTALLLGYAQNGEARICLELFCKMKADGCAPDSVTYIAALKACTSLAVNGRKSHGLKLGKEIHSQIGGNLHIYVQNTLIDMYAKCGSMVSARQVFDSIQKPTVVSWSSLLLGYADNGEGHLCLELFSKMKSRGCVPSSGTYVAVLKACTSLAVKGDDTGGFAMGRKIHLEICDHLNPYLHSTLIGMYAKCRSMVNARLVFDSIQKPDVVSWTALLLGYAENGEGHLCLELFSKMKADGCVPTSVTYVAALKACTSVAVRGDKAQALEMGSMVHSENCGYLNPYLQSTLVDMYTKCGSMVRARQVFDSIRQPDVVAWTALLSGYADNGEGEVCLDLFRKMKAAGCEPDSVTYVAVLKACTSIAVNGGGRGKARGLEMGRSVHLEMGDHLDSYMQSALIDMYAKCGDMAAARQVFDTNQKTNVVSWNALLLGYADNGEGHVCLELFFKMKSDGCVPDAVTYVAALKGCSYLAVNGDDSDKVRGLETGSQIHRQIGEHLDIYVQNTLIDMYSKCGNMVSARQVFDCMRKPDAVSWTALLLGYAENGEAHVALDLFSRMKAAGSAPDSVTHIAALKACASVGALDLGREIHSEMSEFTVHVVTCLVDFYAKCGSMVEAREVFDQNPRARDIATCNALLAGYSSCGDTDSLFELFEAMPDMGFRPDGVTFISVLFCCSHAGLVLKARHYMESMPVQHGVAPDVFHYNCMVDVLGRANQLNEALSVLRGMRCRPDAVTWSALLAASRKWKNVQLGRMAFQSLVEMDKQDASAYAVMAHLYGSCGMWEEQARVLAGRQECHCVEG